MGKIEMRNIMSLLIFHHGGYNNRIKEKRENENEVGICTANKRIFFSASFSWLVGLLGGVH